MVAFIASISTRRARKVLKILSFWPTIIATWADMGLVGTRWAVRALRTVPAPVNAILTLASRVGSSRTLVLAIVQGSLWAVMARLTISLHNTLSILSSAGGAGGASWA